MVICILVTILELYALLENAGAFKKKYNYGFFGYYTNLSNIIVLLYFVSKIFGLKTTAVFDMTVMMTIFVTFLIYHFILSSVDRKAYKEGILKWNFYSITNMSLHYICPILSILYWLVICDKSTLCWYHGLVFLLVPFVYCIYIAVRKKLGITIDRNENYYPYDFMDVDKYGIKTVLKNISILLLLFGTLGIIIATIARKI